MSQDKIAEEISGVEDVNLVAYLDARGFIAIPYMKKVKKGELPRVIFDVQGEGIEKARQDFYGNALIGVRDFVRSLREKRSDLHNMRNIENNNTLTNRSTTEKED